MYQCNVKNVCKMPICVFQVAKSFSHLETKDEALTLLSLFSAFGIAVLPLAFSLEACVGAFNPI